MSIMDFLEFEDNKNIEQNKPILDLSNSIMPISVLIKRMNGKKNKTNALTGVYESQYFGKDVRGLVFRSLIYEKYGSLSKFAKAIKRPKSWIFLIINHPEKVEKIRPETQKLINECLGYNIIFF